MLTTALKLLVNGTNLAKLSNGNDVTINNLVPDSSDSSTWSSDFINNTGGAVTQGTQLDGFTKVLTLEAALTKNATKPLLLKLLMLMMAS